MRVEHGKESLVRISRIEDILDPIIFNQAFHFLNALVDGVCCLKAENPIGFVAAHSIVPQVLELHRCLLDHHVWKVITHLVREVDDSDILPVEVEDARSR